MQWDKKQKGFTIVELLIVVVVIAILAAITIVAYNGISNRAKQSAAQSTTSQAAKKVLTYAVTNSDLFPANKTAFLNATGLTEANGISYQYTASTDLKSFCLTAATNGVSYYASNTQTTPLSGGCVGHGQNGVAAITNIALNPHAVSSGGGWTNQTPAGGTFTYEPTDAQDGGSAYKVVTTAVGQIRIAIPRQAIAVADGDTLTVGLDVYTTVATQVQIEVGTSTGTSFPKSTPVNLNVGWNRVNGSVTFTSATAGTLSLVQLLGVSTGLPAGQTWKASRAIITTGPNIYQYADGGTTNWLWNGTVNNSTSTGPALLN